MHKRKQRTKEKTLLNSTPMISLLCQKLTTEVQWCFFQSDLERPARNGNQCLLQLLCTCLTACMLFGLCLCVCACVLVCTWRQWESGVLFISNARAAIAQQINIEPHDILIPDDSHSIHCIAMESFCILDTNFFEPKLIPAIPSFKLCKFTWKRKRQSKSFKHRKNLDWMK